MRAIATIAFLMACGFAELAHASIATPTCQQMQAAYDALTNSGPISATDGTLSIAVNALADNGLMPKDSTFVGPATRDNIAKHLQSLRPHDRLQWVGRQYGWLTTELLRNKCTGFKERHIELMERALPSNSCLAPGELPKILLDKPL